MAKYLLTFTIRPIVKLESHLRQYSTKLPELKDVGGSYLDKCRPWSDHDNEKLLELVEKHGNKWTLFTNYFPGRSAMHIRQHHLHIAKKYYGLTPEEKNIVQDLLGKEKRVEEIDWEHVQKSLPQRKPIYVIQKYYRFSVNSSFKRGKWTEQETQQLVVLVSKHGKDWRLISQMIETRNENQCIKKYTHEMNMQNAKIGKFSKEEDKALIAAVNKYGTGSFNKIKKEINSERTRQQLRSRYCYFLDPEIDKSPWTQEEKAQIFSLYAELKSMTLVKKKMNSKRSIVALRNLLVSK